MRALSIAITLLLSTLTFASGSHDHGHGHSHGGHGHSHGGHGHPHASSAMAKEKTISTGMFHIERLMKQGKLNATWKNAKHEASVKKKFGKKMEWLVTFENEKGEKGKTKLYIFLKESGEFVAANFTGK